MRHLLSCWHTAVTKSSQEPASILQEAYTTKNHKDRACYAVGKSKNDSHMSTFFLFTVLEKTQAVLVCVPLLL